MSVQEACFIDSMLETLSGCKALRSDRQRCTVQYGTVRTPFHFQRAEKNVAAYLGMCGGGVPGSGAHVAVRHPIASRPSMRALDPR